MMLRRMLAVVAVGAGCASAVFSAGSVEAAPLSKDAQNAVAGAPARPEFIEAKQFRLADGRTPGGPGQSSSRQSVTAWQVVKGMWNGQVLDGLSLVLVQTIAEDGRSRPSMNCYISHRATPAQRRALVNAYAASQPSKSAGAGEAQPVDTSSWRIEPAVIRVETVGEGVVVHVGAIA